MSRPTSPQTAANQPAPTQTAADARTQRHHQILERVLDIGLALLEHIAASAKSATPAPPLELADGYERITRAIRRTILMDQHLDEPALRRAAARRQLVREVENTIKRRARTDSDQESLRAEFRERLDGLDVIEDLALRPVDDIVADICRDLGIAGPPGPQLWPRRTPADIAELCARAAGSQPPPAPQSPQHPAEAERFFHLLATPIDD